MTGFEKQDMPITYLGCPLFSGRAKINYFLDLINNIRNRVTGWHTNLLNQAGKLILILHVLQSMPIHIISAIHPPVAVLREIDKIMRNCFWNDKELFKHHWISWDTCCRTKEEGGLGLRKLQDIVHVQSLKLYWKLCSEDTLWSNFMKVKYHRELNDANSIIRNPSGNWKRLRGVRNEAMLFISQRDLKFSWNLTTDGLFSTKQTWKAIRDINFQPYSFKFVWNKKLPNKILTFMWKLIHGRIPVEMNIKNLGIQLASKCKCCKKSKEERVTHLFFDSEAARKTWNHFTGRVGIRTVETSFNSFLKSWWRRSRGDKEEESIFVCLPMVICWNLWKERNRTVFDGKEMNDVEVIRNVRYEMMDLYRSNKFGKFSGEFTRLFYEILEIRG